jgi:hypothetical protein
MNGKLGCTGLHKFHVAVVSLSPAINSAVPGIGTMEDGFRLSSLGDSPVFVLAPLRETLLPLKELSLQAPKKMVIPKT